MKDLLTKVVYVTFALIILGAVFEILPYKLSLPDELVEMFSNNIFQTLYNYSYYFFPIGFALKLLIFLWISKHLTFIGTLINWIYDKIMG